ncbi:MAG: glycerol-3-phosphate dehydrogenase [Ancrocorticia sp.]|nr:glycerol-3-phosphate dehydrogenase [Ancrocorticia sp.]MCI1964427.1 glycerol-3-phosphate dehydrogenase [Ancrocorticia sp.]MCI2002238.1 glycerol-3-phosphate dehydrogenase [Ancrocorticia sp.]MCI2179244.1 glycerol-3-phosphate dehydrogenase [Ancrocorticia sp.]MCI2194378.1 glycerol-3-phosphate dehydrogenase [Ancrocorticia sp.]
MATIVVLGAGAMGSALCRPLVDSGWNVRLWGTWLDDHLLDEIEAGHPHPRTNVPLAPGVKLYRSNQLAEALDGVNVAVMAVASQGVPKVTELALGGISKADAMWLTSKGFSPDERGKIQLLPDAIRRIASQHAVTLPPIVAIAGPVKANECAAGLTTCTIFGCKDEAVAKRYAAMTTTDNYAIKATDDETGVEICAPMKNIYAIALGIADGLGEATGSPHHNLKAAAFAQAVKEMSFLGQRLGAEEATAYGLAGVGDLEVTGLSGRNKVYGTRIGKGQSAKDAFKEMERLEQTVEGYPAAGLAMKLVAQHGIDVTREMPLLAAVAGIIDASVKDPEVAVALAVRPLNS